MFNVEFDTEKLALSEYTRVVFFISENNKRFLVSCSKTLLINKEPNLN